MDSSPGEWVRLRRGVGEILSFHRRVARVSQGALARATNYDRTSICQIEAGCQFPRERSFWETADAVVRADGVLLVAFDHVLSEELEMRKAVIEREQAGRQARLAEVRSIASFDGIGANGLELSASHAPAGNLRVAMRRPSHTDLVAVAQIRSQVHRLDSEYDSRNSTSLIADTGKYLGQISFLQGHVTSGRVRRELGVAYAEATILMGQLVWDASQRRDHRTANGYFAQAIAAARRLRSSDAEGRALLRSSYVAIYGEKDPGKGLLLTGRTKDAANGCSNVISSFADLHSAEAHAMLGNRRDCEVALDNSLAAVARIDQGDPAIELFSPTQQGRLAGSCYLALGDEGRAKEILRATEPKVRDKTKSHAIVLGNIALACIRRREIEEGISALHDAIDVVGKTRGGGGMNIVFGAARELQLSQGSVGVGEVYDRLLTLMSTN